MEIKKTPQMQLEKQRTTRWLVGLIVALAIFITAMEMTFKERDATIDEAMLDDLAQDLETMPVNDPRDLLAMTRQKMAPQPVVTELVVEAEPELAQANENNVSQSTEPPKVENTEQTPIDEPTLTEVPPPDIDLYQYDGDLRIVEQYPEFPGGPAAFIEWLNKNLRYPAAAKQQKLQGTVEVTFIVGKDGSTARLKVVRSADPLLDKEALRVLAMMPKWKPGLSNGLPCPTMIHIPIVFKL